MGLFLLFLSSFLSFCLLWQFLAVAWILRIPISEEDVLQSTRCFFRCSCVLHCKIGLILYTFFWLHDNAYLNYFLKLYPKCRLFYMLRHFGLVLPTTQVHISSASISTWHAAAPFHEGGSRGLIHFQLFLFRPKPHLFFAPSSASCQIDG